MAYINAPVMGSLFVDELAIFVDLANLSMLAG
jgi:hypothetical protein